MTDRAAQITDFLETAGWGTACRTPLAGDASNRRYERLVTSDGLQAVLMDAPPERGEDVRPFVTIAKHLSGAGLSAPAIFASDPAAGLLLLEDLGDDLFARVVMREPGRENSLYQSAIDVLATLHDKPLPTQITSYDALLMGKLAALSVEWYGSGNPDDAAQIGQMVTDLCAGLKIDVLILRDYHAENLIWLPDRDGVKQVGLLDFQDAMVGHRAYDLVSLLQDARRDVPSALEEQMINRYCTLTGQDRGAFETAYSLLGAQRNLRIIGV
ncbi:MAG TPA: aminoglycoside phosphotransferase, partial [Aliiroseovarius sp.]|nr:aminoglycoside phosphotransferase [Aliiroseovarius sp.]